MVTPFCRRVRLENGQLLSLQKGSVAIHCITGAVWVTWPKSKETVLQEGQQLILNTAGKVCVQALAGSQVDLR